MSFQGTFVATQCFPTAHFDVGLRMGVGSCLERFGQWPNWGRILSPSTRGSRFVRWDTSRTPYDDDLSQLLKEPCGSLCRSRGTSHAFFAKGALYRSSSGPIRPNDSRGHVPGEVCATS